MILWIVLALLLVGAAWLVGTFNSLVRGRNHVDEAWSDIEVQLKRRYDLIPNLVETVKGYARHEEGVFTKVTQARSTAMSAKTPAEHAQAENMLSQTLKSLFAVAEAYPNLQAAGNFAQLQSDLTDAENKIESSRRFYNGNVRDYNTMLQSFPTNLIAGTFGFGKRDFFDAPDSVNEAPKVAF
jgi:LemA protein